MLGAKAMALIEGRLNVSCEDVRKVAKPVLRHRIFTNFNADAEGVGPDQVVDKLLSVVPEGVGEYTPRVTAETASGNNAVWVRIGLEKGFRYWRTVHPATPESEVRRKPASSALLRAQPCRS